MIIQRLPADRPGPKITDSALVDDASKISRGKQEINRNDSNRVFLTAELFKKQVINYNKLVHVIGRDNIPVGGIIDSFELSLSFGQELELSTEIVIEQVKL